MEKLQRIFPRQLVPQAVVDALLGQQLVVGARLFDALCAQHEDAVVVLDGGQAVGDGQGSAAMGFCCRAGLRTSRKNWKRPMGLC